ncbi:MAG: membrane protein insertion efficiency factor YidD [Candidatus Moraniibacteriota bacterium]
MFAKLLIVIIKLYQKLLSPDQSFWGKRLGFKICRFHPTCSQYAIDALQKHGVVKGNYLAVKRVLRCHPWNPGGHDPVR